MSDGGSVTVIFFRRVIQAVSGSGATNSNGSAVAVNGSLSAVRDRGRRFIRSFIVAYATTQITALLANSFPPNPGPFPRKEGGVWGGG